MRKIVTKMLLVTAMIMAMVSMAYADAILFPYWAKSSTVDTLISVINVNALTGALHYIYFGKSVGMPAGSACMEDNFSRPTSVRDIVTFAVGGATSLGSGKAMFNDPSISANYLGADFHANDLFVKLNSSFANGASINGAYGLLMVEPFPATASGAGGTPAVAQLDGEASIYDISTGAMWGYRAIPSANNTVSPYDFTYSNYVVDAAAANTPPVTTIARFANAPKVVLYAPNQFTHRLFVTPVNSGMDTTTRSIAANIAAFYGAGSTNATTSVGYGLLDRDEGFKSGGEVVTATCVRRVNVDELVGGSVLPGGSLYTQGGYFAFGMGSGSALVFDLKFGVITGMSGMVNDGKPIVRQSSR